MGTGHDRALIIQWIEREPQHGLILLEFENRFKTRHCTMQWADDHIETIYQDDEPLFDTELANYYDQISPTLVVDFD